MSAVRNLSLLEGDEALEKPSETDNDEIQQSFLRKLHHLLFEIHIMQGFLICPESGRRFPVVDGMSVLILSYSIYQNNNNDSFNTNMFSIHILQEFQICCYTRMKYEYN